ncbi:MAG: hypothetical protein AAF804_00325 [Bacteroidota bacterium]
MKRKNAPQISNAAWFPAWLRSCVHEFMTWFVKQIRAARPFLPVVNRGLEHADRLLVIDYQLGAGFETLDPWLDPDIPREIIQEDQIGGEGLYLVVNSFHQRNPAEAYGLLSRIFELRQPVAIVEGNNDNWWQVVGMTVFVPLTVILTAPLVKPFRWERLLFTYLIPILPLVTFWDGFMALFKLYAPQDLDELVSGLQAEDYTWESGKMDNGRGGKIMYLLGLPVPENTDQESREEMALETSN